MKHIELFAGCGGLTLGLESAGFELLFANELSPMAAETFAYNLLGENLEYFSSESKLPDKTLWVSSQFSQKELSKRLREDPREAAGLRSKFSEMPLDIKQLQGKLLVGSIVDINHILQRTPKLVKQLQKT